MEQKLIPEEMYKELALKTNLNGLWRNLFSAIDTLPSYERLLVQANQVRAELIESIQPEMIKGISNGLVRSLPLLFVKDASSRSGAHYLRWRNAQNNKNGENAWKNIITDPTIPEELKNALVQTEKERITYNMQMAIIAHIIRQLRECQEKVKFIEDLNQ